MDAPSSLAGISRRLADLRDFQLPRLRSCRGPASLHAELAAEMRSDLEAVRRSIEVTMELAESSRTSAERDELLARCDAAERELVELRTAYREALVQSKRTIASISRVKPSSSDFAAPTSEPDQKRDTRSTEMSDDALQTKTNEVTDALRRTTHLMQAELERSVLSVQMLEQSTQTLRLTTQLYDTYASLLSTASHLVRALERADWYDRLILLAALLLFLCTVAWIVKRRVLDRVLGGVGWLGWGLGWWVRANGRLVGLAFGRGRGRGRGGTVGKGGEVGSLVPVLERGKMGQLEGGGIAGMGLGEEGVGQGKERDSVLDVVVPPVEEGLSAVTRPDPPAPIAEAVAGEAAVRQRDEL